VNAAQRIVLETLLEAYGRGLVEPILIGEPAAIETQFPGKRATLQKWQMIAAAGDASAAASAVDLVRRGRADAIMKGYVHTDVFMRALLDADRGLRVPGRRVSHVFVTEIPSYSKLLHITDAAINIKPDLEAKRQILLNAIELAHLMGVPSPKVAVLSAVETVNPQIESTVDAACLAVMATRGQIPGATVDGPLAFDLAISAAAAREKQVRSEVAGDADIVLVPDLVAGNILAKDLEYLAGASAAGVVMGLSAPVLLNSRSDSSAARLAAVGLAALLFHQRGQAAPAVTAARDSHDDRVAPQPEHLCCPLSGAPASDQAPPASVLPRSRATDGEGQAGHDRTRDVHGR
jgi:phosphotransacetylase